MEHQPTSSRGGQSGGQSTNPSADFAKTETMAQNTADTIQQAAGQTFDQVREQGKHQIAGQKNQVAGTIDQVAQAMRQTGWHLRQDEQDNVAHWVDEAASQLEGFSSSLRQKNVEEIIGEAQNFARRQPALFLGGAFMLGLFAARFLRSTPPEYQGMNGGYGMGQGYGAGYGRGPRNRMGSNRQENWMGPERQGDWMGPNTGTGEWTQSQSSNRPHPRPPQASVYDDLRGEGATRRPMSA